MAMLILTCIITPLRLAMVPNAEDETLFWKIVLYFIDFCFFVDILIIFNTAIYDQYFCFIEDRKAIAKEYIKGWFFIDLVAILPFDLILSASGFNGLFRIARITRLYKLVKLTRLLRVIKLLKNQAKMVRIFADILKVGPGFERLYFFVLIFFMIAHFITCLWIMFPQFMVSDDEANQGSGTWVESFYEEGYTSGQLYATSFYWTITTITTVGYGDIHGVNPNEKLFCSVIMIIGVISFSFVSGSLASIMTNIDKSNAAQQSKTQKLEQIYKENSIPHDLFLQCKRHFQYNRISTDDIEIENFLEELPHHLKAQFVLYIHEERYKAIKFFKGKNRSFITWICPQLKPICFAENQNIFFEGDDIKNIFFLSKGNAGYVLPKYENTIYINIQEGDHFGIIDLLGSCSNNFLDHNDWISRKTMLQCQFTIQALTEVTVQSLSIENLYKMQLEFPDIYDQLFNESITILRRTLIQRFKAMKECRLQYIKQIKSQASIDPSQSNLEYSV